MIHTECQPPNVRASFSTSHLTPPPLVAYLPALQLSASRLLLHDLSPNTPQPQLPPPVRGTPVPRVARLLAIDRLSVSHTASFSGGGGGVRSGGPHSETRIELQDLTVEGYAGEAGSFLSR